ncbi:putative bifunctional fatty acid transporter/acyl-CoA synthetase (FAT1) [Aspergillus clavatus NRRL 1]|uniref:Bifunctional fatty acid transporter/acyl-CoA synthetase (FAT1), putative n=1 Tax=Aspergillus clavatus (strain ATCC 1007 / CBS 513.65 / DSM 816 / NCTC 3887 / NRRL 1 / QM 1276 / 107) TaxID=344612 RepID=A1C6H9_ASPCL|nr:bifunctional fatty acid transporter/acyl-CoA synthetase (FAT1), putative [Aspergillus clavatus NRRL 1]EAW14000.1 bifunctional fatty acid transporter/acyl-CoA synthetase (FAT1), putative [Aspergillus clavatus NRRL 1]
MELFSEISAPSLAVASALTVAAGAYLNAKFSVSTDLNNIFNDRAWANRLGQRIGELKGVATVYKMLERVVDVQGYGDRDALWFENKTWTYSQLKDLVDRFAALLHARDIKAGDFVAVFNTNSPEMVVTIYALSKLGAVAALINNNLRDDTFVHCLDVSDSKFIISTPDLSQFVCSDLPHIALNISSFDGVSVEPTELITVADLQRFSPTGLAPANRSIKDLCALIYTSGTTGKPKACGIRNMMNMITSTPLSTDTRSPSKYYPLRSYSALPLFHGTAYFTGLCYSVGNAGTLCLRRKFSASQFWKDVHDSRATRILYIGELCRYLLATPPSPYDQYHACIVATGNGLRGEIWERFKQRFNIPEIREFYRSTEGVAKFDNHGPGVWGAGKVGFSGPLRRFMEEDTFIVKYDTETEMPYRDPATGFCIKAKLGEEGEAIGRVKDRALLTEYLHNEDATEKKLLRDVFVKGDLFQRTGDLVVQDESGWVRFQDRVGDTFRWKGENVSAGEVRDHICRIPAVHDAVVYGVKLSGYDGQAGAAGITLEDPAMEVEFMANLHKELKKKGVPSYAIPRLVRLTEKVATGVTFKQAKGDLTKKGWNPRTEAGGDKLYWLNGTTYQKLDEQSWSSIDSGLAKL